MCTICGDQPNQPYYKQCYGTDTPPIPPHPTPEPDEGMCGVPCTNHQDCQSEYVGTYNPCTVCSRYSGYVGTQWVCIEPSEASDDYDDDDSSSSSDYSAKYLRASRNY